jgi:parallel beta-helix repeat protein
MKKLSINFIKSTAIICLLFFSFSTTLFATNVSGNQGDSTWTLAKSPYVITGDVIVGLGKTLTINPGVTVLFTTGDIQLFVQGTLKAIGTGTDSIYFVRKGIFQYQNSPIYFENTSLNSVLKYVKVDSLGFNYNYNSDLMFAIYLKSSSCTISNCTIQNTRGVAIGIAETVKPVISNNVFLFNTNLDIVLNADELKNIIGNNPLNIGLYQTIPLTNNDTLKADNNFYRLLRSLTIPVFKMSCPKIGLHKLSVKCIIQMSL